MLQLEKCCVGSRREKEFLPWVFTCPHCGEEVYAIAGVASGSCWGCGGGVGMGTSTVTELSVAGRLNYYLTGWPQYDRIPPKSVGGN